VIERRSQLQCRRIHREEETLKTDIKAEEGKKQEELYSTKSVNNWHSPPALTG
jgi:hypothetical protein